MELFWLGNLVIAREWERNTEIPKRCVRYIIKLQSSHRSWCRDVKVKTFASPCVCRSFTRVSFEKGQFFVSRYNFIRPSSVLFWSELRCVFHDHKFYHFSPTARLYRWTFDVLLFCRFRWTLLFSTNNECRMTL